MDIFKGISNRINGYRKIPPSVVNLHQAIKKILPKNPIILEAGAHMGYDTLGLSKIWPKGLLHAFEPIPILYQGLCYRVKSQSNVKTYNIALGESDTTTFMYVSSGQSNASSSILEPSKHLVLFPGVSFDEKIQVQMKKINSWASENDVAKVDLMWLDMQGYEVKALKEADKIMRDVKVIYTELCQDELYKGLSTREAYIHFLEMAGFTLISDIHSEEAVSDGIFVNNRFL
jgi:FkbM family methyltransferase